MKDDKKDNLVNASLNDLIREIKARCVGMVICIEKELPNNPGYNSYYVEAMGTPALQMGLCTYMSQWVDQKFMTIDPEDDSIDIEPSDDPLEPPEDE